MDLGQYPDSLAELVSKNPPSALNEEIKKLWKGPYVKAGLPKDPWGREYQYAKESQHEQDYDLYSLGPDGQPGGNDDISNWD